MRATTGIPVVVALSLVGPAHSERRVHTTGSRILLVEDDEDNATVFILILRRQGYAVTAARDGREAMRMLERETFDVVVTDMLMPNADGVELLVFIRSMAQRPAVVPMSGGGIHLTAAQMLSLAVKMGATAPLVKPFTAQQLLDAISTALHQGAEKLR